MRKGPDTLLLAEYFLETHSDEFQQSADGSTCFTYVNNLTGYYAKEHDWNYIDVTMKQMKPKGVHYRMTVNGQTREFNVPDHLLADRIKNVRVDGSNLVYPVDPMALPAVAELKEFTMTTECKHSILGKKFTYIFRYGRKGDCTTI